ncbi:MAG TPA: DEAD/DEAH box helicase, partial [Clostridia bacterium]|nr:DEAD/DEAH box helicase [Clostridia bacterium]
MIKEDFKDYGLNSKLLKAIDILGFESPSKVQREVIPLALKERDIAVQSQTGSGKTAAFGIPICQLVDWSGSEPQALVITPTRELAIQVREDIFNIGRFKRLKVLAVYGKSPFYNQERQLKQKTHIVVGTPGRIMDHIDKGTLDLSEIRYLVIDEADEMFNMGFIDQIEAIIEELPRERTTMLFSATMPQNIESLCYKNMNDPMFIQIEAESLIVDRIEQERYQVDERDKRQLLKDLTIVENPDSCIVFCNTRDRVDGVYADLKRNDYNCEKIHGGMEQKDRLQVMENFKQGYFRYLVATDVAARGIDVDGITHIINYDIPRETEAYVHRIGRTGRVDRKGKAITFVTGTE